MVNRMLTKNTKRKCLSSYLNIKNLYRLDYMEEGRIIFFLVGLEHPSVSVARYPCNTKEKVTLCIFTGSVSSPDNKGLVPVNRSSISRVSLLSNRCIFSVGPPLNKPSKPGYDIKSYPYCGFCSNRILHYFPMCVSHRRDISSFLNNLIV